ncbi:serine/threonine-protein kinase [Quadrisphaera sp. DSM 44207]|uniref:serine/threonine-protein kinase n=1 Tax=Quadrisphaera sp. DSM 44207 TaxID=1881057 RepID=UPI0015A1F1BF|nr:serine/threonine-protein kinase [Quadrisphaera sp. DSM 44207]
MVTEGAGRVVAGRYRISSRLGSGGMGTVWAARDDVLRRDVALKEVLPPAGLPAQERAVVVERTRREARAAAAIASPAVMTVYDVVEEGERTWIVMERLEELTLADVIDERGSLPPQEAARIGLGVLDALEAAHAVGVLHRDVKPGNVMRGPGGRVVLADFGIAQAPGEAALTEVGVVLGSPAYLAPERAHGGPARPASDLWGLGATLYAAVEGRPPFDGPGALAVLTAVVADDVPPAPRAGPLAPVIEGLLRKDPDERLTAAQARPLLERAARWTGDVAAAPAARQAEAAATGARATGAAATGAAAPPPRWTPPPPPPSRPASPEPAGRPGPAGRPERPGRTGRRGALLAAGAGVLALGAVLGASLLADDERDTAGAAPSAPASSAAPQEPAATSSASQEQPAQAAPVAPTAPSAPSAAAPSSGAPSAASSPVEELSTPVAEVPDGFEPYTDETGFRVAVPAGWQAEREGPRVYFRDPDTSRYLLVDQTDTPQPDALADWRAQEPSVAERLDGYERIRLERIALEGYQDGAEWEFRHGQSTRVVNRNLLVDDAQAYALYFSGREGAWEEDRALFDRIAPTFRPAA